MWFVFALLSAVFAALTSILTKIGIEDVVRDAHHHLEHRASVDIVLVVSWWNCRVLRNLNV